MKNTSRPWVDRSVLGHTPNIGMPRFLYQSNPGSSLPVFADVVTPSTRIILHLQTEPAENYCGDHTMEELAAIVPRGHIECDYS